MNPEDHGRKSIRTDDRVERVRRIHQNDLENIPIFCVIGFLFVYVNPTPSSVYYLYTFTISRVIHTFTYLLALQPFRAISFFFGIMATIGMGVHLIIYSLA